jgi:hypothetical protein
VNSRSYGFATLVIIALVLTKKEVKDSLTIYDGLDRGLIVWRSIFILPGNTMVTGLSAVQASRSLSAGKFLGIPFR